MEGRSQLVWVPLTQLEVHLRLHFLSLALSLLDDLGVSLAYRSVLTRVACVHLRG